MKTIEQLGTLEWSRRTGGRLSPKEREALLKQQVAREASAAAGAPWSGAHATDRGLARMDIDRVRFPDSIIARRAEELVERLCTPALAQHCYRTYLWGSLLAQHDALTVDEELFYLASLLHDLGATEQYFARNPAVHCFAVEGAMAADAFLSEEGWSAERRDLVAEAITLHVNLSVDLHQGPVAYCLSAGTHFDLEGQRASELPQSTVDEVLRRHPGLGIGEEFMQFVVAEAQAHPEGRVAWLLAHSNGGELFPFGESSANRSASSPFSAGGHPPMRQA